MIPDTLRFPPGGKPWLLYGILSTSIVLNLGLALRFSGDAEPVVPPEEVPVVIQPVLVP